MKWTCNTWLKTLSTTCDLDLVPAWLKHRFCTSPLWGIDLTKSSAHHLDEVNILPEFHEIIFKGLKVMGQTWNTWFKPLNTTGDLDLKLARLGYGFCTSSWWGKQMTKVSWNSFQGFRKYGADTKYMVQTLKTTTITEKKTFWGEYWKRAHWVQSGAKFLAILLKKKWGCLQKLLGFVSKGDEFELFLRLCIL
jgi:hypothetical protein